ncbi:MAG: chemotaxis protein CheX [Candidatus Firestonebacteria bacterium]|nr:chemotaxis protein CheX [Candidatus Firestonebacteria bacterium]
MPTNEQHIIQVTQEILETLAFLSTRPVEEVTAVRSERAAVGVEYAGPTSGILLLDLPVDVLPELAANMLGVDPGEEGGEKQRQDALGELGNVLCGNLLGRINGAEPVFNLKAPRLLTAAELQQWRECGQAVSAKLGLNQGWCEVSLVAFDAKTARGEAGRP